MRIWLFACALFIATPAAAQQYQYVARTEAPALRQGAVTAGALTWQCQGSACTISGPWPAPAAQACAQLAREVGRIVAYGRQGNMLDAAGLATCNAGLPTASLRAPPTAILRNPTVTARLQPPPIAVPELSFVGGGAAGARESTTTTLNTPELSFVGGGAATTSAPVSVSIEVPELSFIAR